MSEQQGSSWQEYQKLVLHELQKHTNALEKIEAEIKDIHIELATVKVKGGIWGLLAGAVPVIIALIIKLL
jgi:hypothetical protein